jgi:hypothetical protein
MKPDNAAHRNSEQPKRIIVPQILLRRKGQSPDVRDGFDVIRLDTGFIKGLPVKTHRVIDPLYNLLQALQL